MSSTSGRDCHRSRADGRPLAQDPQDLRALRQLCREGRLYDVERWIAEERPIQLGSAAIPKGTRAKTALQIALETGQHSLGLLLLRSGYRLELERYRPLDVALQSRRWDLFDLLLDWGGSFKDVDVYTVLNTYNVSLYERFRAAGYDLTEGHEMGSVLGQGTRNRPLLGFVKRYRTQDAKIQTELDIALGYHARAGNERGVSLCLWAGANPHAPAPNPELGLSEDTDAEDGQEHFVGWSAIEEAAKAGHLTILKRLGPDPGGDDFDNLYRYAKYESTISFLATIQLPKDLTSILSWHLRWVEDRFPWVGRRGTGVLEAVLTCGARWEESNPGVLGEIRRSLLKVNDCDLKTIMSRLKRPGICEPETYQELIRTPRMQGRLLALGLVRKAVNERERRRDELARLMTRYDRAALYKRVWSEPVQKAAKSLGISGVRLGKVCRKLQIPVPPRGYWARVRSGQTMRMPSLSRLDM